MRRVLCLLFICLLILPCLCIPAFAYSEEFYEFTYDGVDCITPGHVSVGNANFGFSYYDENSEQVWLFAEGDPYIDTYWCEFYVTDPEFANIPFYAKLDFKDGATTIEIRSYSEDGPCYTSVEGSAVTYYAIDYSEPELELPSDFIEMTYDDSMGAYVGPSIPAGDYEFGVFTDDSAMRIPSQLHVPEFQSFPQEVTISVSLDEISEVPLYLEEDASGIIADEIPSLDFIFLIPSRDEYVSRPFDDGFVFETYITSGKYEAFVVFDGGEYSYGIWEFTPTISDEFGVGAIIPEIEPGYSAAVIDTEVGISVVLPIRSETGDLVYNFNSSARLCLRRIQDSSEPFSFGFDVISGVMDSLYSLICNNPLFSALFAGVLLMVCIPLYSDLKKTSK